MSYDHDCSAYEEMLKCSRHLLLTVAIEGCCWFIEEDDFWVFQKYLCNSEALFLTSAEPHAAFTYFRFYTVF